MPPKPKDRNMNRAAYRAWTRPLAMDLARRDSHARRRGRLLPRRSRWRRHRRRPPIRWSPRSTASRSAKATSRSPRRTSARTSRRRSPATPGATSSSSYLADIMLVAKAAEAEKVAEERRVQAPPRFIRNKLLMEALLQDEGKAAVDRRGDAQGLRRAPSSRWAARRRCARATSWWPTEDEAKAIARRPQEGRRLRGHRQGEVEGSGRRGAGRRSRLLHQGPDGAGIRRSGVQARRRASSPTR